MSHTCILDLQEFTTKKIRLQTTFRPAGQTRSMSSEMTEIWHFKNTNQKPNLQLTLHTSMLVASPTRSVRQTRRPWLGSTSQRCSVLILGVVERWSQEKEVNFRASNYPSVKLFVPPPTHQHTHGRQSPDDNRKESNDRSQSPPWGLPHRNGLWAGPTLKEE